MAWSRCASTSPPWSGRRPSSLRSRSRAPLSSPNNGWIKEMNAQRSTSVVFRFRRTDLLLRASDLKSREGLVDRHEFQPVDVHLRRKFRDPQQRGGDVFAGHRHESAIERVRGRLVSLGGEDYAFGLACLFGEQSRHPARGQCRRKRQPDGRAGTFRHDHTFSGQCRDDAPTLPLTPTENPRDLAALQFSSIEQGFQNDSRLWRKFTQSALFFSPHLNARFQAIRLHKTFHKGHLVKTGLEKEFREGSKRFLAQRTASVEVIAARQIACRQMALVSFDIPRQTPGD